MSDAQFTPDEVTLPIKRTAGDTLAERLTSNAYHDILPARYLQRDADGNVKEEQEELFERVARNIALAEAVFEAEKRDTVVHVRPDQLKPDHPRRDELAAEVFGAGTTADDDVETPLRPHNVNKFAYETVVPELPGPIREHVESVAGDFRDMMERLAFVPNSPTLMNAGGELQQLSACFVMSPDDDLTDIHETATNAAEVFQCLTDDAMVHRKGTGIVPISEVDPGDEIRQRHGGGVRFRSVEDVHTYEDAPVRRIRTGAGIELTGTPNHELLVDGDWSRIDEIEPGDSLSVRLGWIPDEDETAELSTVPGGGEWDRTRTVANRDIIELHGDGLTDYEIADRLQCGSSTIQQRRADELGLEPNGSGGRPGGSVTFDTDEFEELYGAGCTDGEIAAELGVSSRTVLTRRKQLDLEPNGDPVAEVEQPTTLTPDLAELAGMWVGDGSKHQDGIRFHLAREGVLQRADRHCLSLFDAGLDWRWEDGCYDAVLHSHEIRRWWLANFGQAKPTAPEARVPECILRADHRTIGAFLRGLFSTDGSLSKGLYPRLWSSSEALVDEVQQLLIGLGIPAVKWELDSDERDYFTVGPTGERGVKRFVDLVGFVDGRTDEMEAAIERTDVRGTTFGTIRDGTTWELPVETVENAGTATVYDLTVADDPEYLANAVVSHNSGGGCGYAFWQLRPYGDPVGSTGGIASGPITFMRTYDQLCETIAQGGTRRGAQMGVMRVSHPDVIEFIHAKNKDVSLAHCLRLNDPDDHTYTSFSEALEEARGLIDEEGRVPEHLRNAVEGHLSNFNISVGVTDGFMQAMNAGEEFTFTNPRTGDPHVATEETVEMYSRYGLGDHVEVGEELSLPAELLWERIVQGAHENGEPGVIYLERVNEEHSFDVDEHPDHRILATNPCGEQPLEEYEACNLGHINLSTIAAKDAPDWRVWSDGHLEAYDTLEEAVEAYLESAVDWTEFDRRIELGTRFLENVVTMSDFPVAEIERTVREMRKIGLGIMGLAQLDIQLGMRYGSDASNEVARQLMTHINRESKWASHELAEARGVFEEWENSKYATPTEYREWFEHQTGLDADEWRDGFPIRNHNTTTIAPTGTTSMVGNTTGGCEPVYNVAYYKNVSDDVQGEEMLVEFDDYFLRVLEANDIDVAAVKREAKAQMADNEFEGVESLDTVPDPIGELFVTTGDLAAKEHAAVQCACQTGVDSAISKCLVEGSLVQTDDGLIAVEDFGTAGEDGPDSFADPTIDTTVDGYEVASHYYAGEKDATRVRLDNGASIAGATRSHRVLTPDGWTVLGDLSEEDIVVGRHSESHGEGRLRVDSEEVTQWANDVDIPERMSPEYAELLGMIAADGCVIESNGSIKLTAEKDCVVERYGELCGRIFGVAPSRYSQTSRTDSYVINSKALGRQISGLVGTGAYEKRVPEQVLRGSPDEKLAFLRGVTLDGYGASNGFCVYSGVSEDLADGIESICRSFGVPKVYRGTKFVEESNAYAHHVNVSNEMQDLVDPVDPRKNTDGQSVRYKVLCDVDDIDLSEYDGQTDRYYAARSVRNRGKGYVFHTTAEKIGLDEHVPVHKVTDVEDLGKQPLYDIEVEESHEYVVNGIVSHNTVNAPSSSTVEDAKEVFQYIYDNGGKGVTYYRDGTRSKQVLTTRADNTEFAGMDEDEAAEVLVDRIREVFGDVGEFLDNEGVREQLEADVDDLLGEPAPEVDYADKRPRPDALQGVSQRIDTGYGKLYVTINEDPETAEPFELFANIGHSGGFTNSFTEALAKVISTALRSGVDPEEVVDELVGTRSPKVAWDKGEQINSIPDAIGTALRRYLEGEIDKPYPKQANLDEIEEQAGRSAPEDPEPDGGAVRDRTGDSARSIVDAGESPECPECGAMTLDYAEGCKTCKTCGWSEC